MFSKLKIYSDKKWLPASTNHTIMLYPFWGDIPLLQSDPDFGRFDEYLKNGKDVFEMVDNIKDADYALLPFEYSFKTELIKLVQVIASETKSYDKKLIIFFNSDDTTPININNTIVFRTSFFKSQQKTNEFAFPGWSIDFMKKFKPENLFLKKNVLPKISYCGYIDYLDEPQKGFLGKVKSLLKPMRKENLAYGSYIRGKAIRLLKKSEIVSSDFIIRDGFWAQGIDDKQKVREEYMANMFNSPYALVTRGAGNFSYRLIEVMSSGRIPVFINTDSVLPLEKIINWKEQCVWIEEKEIGDIDRRIADFHKEISETDFMNLQKKNRAVYEEYLSPLGFFKHIHTQLLSA